MAHWTREYFDRGYAQRWTLGPPSEETKHEAGDLWRLLGLASGATVLDVGCGHGRHVIPLALQGAKVTGLDSSRQLLGRARGFAAGSGVVPSLIRADMRRLPLRSGYFHAALLLD